LNLLFSMTLTPDSNLRNVTCLKYYKIEIEGDITFLEVRQYHSNRYLCIFSNVVNTQVFSNPLYGSDGFKVIYDEHAQAHFIVSGALTQACAAAIWAQVSYRLEEADHCYMLNGL